MVKHVFLGGSMILTTMDGDDLPHPVNAECDTVGELTWDFAFVFANVSV